MFSFARYRERERPSVSLALGFLVRTSPPRIRARPGRWDVVLVFFATGVFDYCSGGGRLRQRLAYPRLWCHPDGSAVLIIPLPFTRTTHDGSWARALLLLLLFWQLYFLALPPCTPAHRKGGYRSWLGKDDKGGLGLEGGGA